MQLEDHEDTVVKPFSSYSIHIERKCASYTCFDLRKVRIAGSYESRVER